MVNRLPSYLSPTCAKQNIYLSPNTSVKCTLLYKIFIVCASRIALQRPTEILFKIKHGIFTNKTWYKQCTTLSVLFLFDSTIYLELIISNINILFPRILIYLIYHQILNLQSFGKQLIFYCLSLDKPPSASTPKNHCKAVLFLLEQLQSTIKTRY